LLWDLRLLCQLPAGGSELADIRNAKYHSFGGYALNNGIHRIRGGDQFERSVCIHELVERPLANDDARVADSPELGM